MELKVNGDSSCTLNILPLNPLHGVESYDLSTHTWTSVAGLPNPLHGVERDERYTHHIACNLTPRIHYMELKGILPPDPVRIIEFALRGNPLHGVESVELEAGAIHHLE